MAAPTSRPPARRPFALLVGVAVLTLAVLAFLILFPRPTVVELVLQVDRAAFTVVPAHSASAAPDPVNAVPLLASTLAVSAFEVRQAGRLEATFEEGPAALRPGSAGSIRFTAPEPFQPELTAYGRLRLTVETSGRDRAGNDRIAVSLEPAATASWNGHLPAGSVLTVALRDSEILRADSGSAAEPGHVDQATRRVPENAPDPLIVSGPGEGLVGLTVPARSGPATLLRVLDPATGDLTAPRSLPFATAELRSFPWRDRLVLLAPAPGDTAPRPLLRSGLKVRDAELYRMIKLDPESALLGGQIRFPGGEQSPFDLVPRSLVTLTAAAPLTLRSLALADGHLELVLWGRSESVKAGPAPDLLAEVLPNRLTWLYSHRLSALIYSVVATVLGASLGIFRLLGFLKADPS